MRLFAASCLLLTVTLTACTGGQASSPRAQPTVSATSTVLAAPPPGPASMRCGTTKAPLTADMTVAQWRLGAVHFLSPDVGVAVTAGQFYCHSATGVVNQVERGLLTVSTDAGSRWVTQGTALPAGPVDQVAAFSTRVVWALTGAGTLYATANGGATWTRQPFPGPVLTITQAGDQLTALFYRAAGAYRPRIDTLDMPGGSWRPVHLPLLDTVPQLAFARGSAFTLLATSPAAELISTTGDGASWTTRSVSAGPDGICVESGQMLTATAPGELWVLCERGQGMQKAAQVLLRTQDDGRTWQVMSQLLGPPSRPGTLPFEGANTIAAFSATLLWITGINFIAYSSDAGRTWSVLNAINPAQAYPVTLDVLSATGAWLLSPGAGMWRTTDGLHWVQLGPYFLG